MSITVADVPQSLKTDKSVYQYICRSIELAEAEPVISYYCQIYVLEYILSNKIHTVSKENELFTVKLLDSTELIKNSTENESLHKILTDKSLSISVIFTFVLRLFNSCLTSLQQLTQLNRSDVIGKFKVTLEFFQLFSIFESESSIDWSKLSGINDSNWEEFNKSNQKKIKILKLNLAKLLKNQIPYLDSNQDEDLEKELNDELDKISQNVDESIDNKHENEEELDIDFGLPKSIIDPSDKDIRNIGAENNSDKNNNEIIRDPELEKDLSNEISNSTSKNSDSLPAPSGDIELPVAPHFELDNNNDVQLPGVPKYFPDDDLTGINKSSSIKVMPPSVSPKSKPSSRKPSFAHHNQSSAAHTPPITKETIDSIIDRNEAINKVQKHAKFAVSALNYEDIETAEKELLKGLELLKLLKNDNE